MIRRNTRPGGCHSNGCNNKQSSPPRARINPSTRIHTSPSSSSPSSSSASSSSESWNKKYLKLAESNQRILASRPGFYVKLWRHKWHLDMPMAFPPPRWWWWWGGFSQHEKLKYCNFSAFAGHHTRHPPSTQSNLNYRRKSPKNPNFCCFFFAQHHQWWLGFMFSSISWLLQPLSQKNGRSALGTPLYSRV